MMDIYDVVWSKTAIRSLSKLYNINPQTVFLQSKYILSQHPHKKAVGIVNYPGFDFNGYYWILIKNVVLIFRISETYKRILIDAVYFANTKESAQIFWGIEPEEE
jgi:hypothetical protein